MNWQELLEKLNNLIPDDDFTSKEDKKQLGIAFGSEAFYTKVLHTIAKTVVVFICKHADIMPFALKSDVVEEPMDVPNLTKDTIAEICKQLGIENLGDLGRNIQVIKETAEKPAPIDINAITNAVCERQIGNRGFLMALSQAQKEGRDKSMQYKKESITKIVADLYGIPQDTVNLALVERLYADRVTTGREDAWPGRISERLESWTLMMEDTLRGMLLKTQTSTDISSEAKFLVNMGISADNSLEDMRRVLESFEIDLVAKLRKK